jgi:6-phosphofructokinase 1
MMEGKTNHLVGLRGEYIKTTPIDKAIEKSRNVDPNGELVKTAQALGTSFGDK